MIVRGRCINGQRSQKKFDLACTLMQMDYTEMSRCSNMFLMMTKAQENEWECNRRNAYYNNFTASQLEKMIEIRRSTNING